MTITEELVKKVRKWLGKDGRKFFTWCVEEHGEVSPVYMEDYGDKGRKIPHPVHNREGMNVRNFMRGTGLCDDWDDYDLDDNWAKVVEKAIISE